MNKIIVINTDRTYNDKLDLRSRKLHSLNVFSFFKVNENMEVLNYLTTRSYYGNGSLVRDLKLLFEDKLPENVKNYRGSNPISKNEFEKFVKFAKKHGSVLEYEELDPSTIENLLNFVEISYNINEEIKTFLTNCKEINPYTKNGNFRKINYKNIVIVDRKNHNSYLSQPDTTIKHKLSSSYAIIDFKLSEINLEYYSIFNLVGWGEVDFTIYSVGKNGGKKYLELIEKFSKNNDLISLECNKILNNFTIEK